MHRRKRDKYKLQSLADAMKRDKSEVSRWFSKPPNWQLNTISDIANALDLEIEIRARERSTGVVYAPYGVVHEVRAEIILSTDERHFVTATNPSDRMDIGTKIRGLPQSLVYSV